MMSLHGCAATNFKSLCLWISTFLNSITLSMKSILKPFETREFSTSTHAVSQKEIDPSDLINKYTVEDLNFYSDQYYKLLPTPEMQMGKPFSTPKEVAHHLHHLGILFDCLKVSPTMKVLDFGAGTCWLSKILWQMGCDVVASDVSETSLRLGQKLFEEFPVPTPRKGKISFNVFDGHTIHLPSESVDRIVCYDVLHHIPNLPVVLREFFRVLKPSGVVALSEPISEIHSSSVQSQHEMKTYRVLENNLDPVDLCQSICDCGFERPRFKLYPSLGADISFDDYMNVRSEGVVPRIYVESGIETARNEGVFYFLKPGTRIKDSRQAEGLAHQMSVDQQTLKGRVGQTIRARFKIENVGDALWISQNDADVGVVKVGASFQRQGSEGPPVDFHRTFLPRSIHPGESIDVDVNFQLEEPGQYIVKFDLVSEVVTWFEHHGSVPVCVDVRIR